MMHIDSLISNEPNQQPQHIGSPASDATASIMDDKDSSDANQELMENDEIPKSRKLLSDDSSDDEPLLISRKKILVTKIDDSSNDEKSSGAEDRKKTIKKTRKFIQDSEEESDNDDPLPVVTADSQNIVYSDNSSHSDSDESSKSARVSRKSGSDGSVKRSGSDESSGGERSDVEESIEAIKSKILNKHKASKSILLSDNEKENLSNNKGRAKPKKEKAPSRKAKEAALAEIHSETHRMVRERQISLPYHVPKQRTLADFLNRRKTAPVASLKTTSEELEKVLKHVEEREKAAEDFYKSETGEEDVDKEKKDNPAVTSEQSKPFDDHSSSLSSNPVEATSQPSDVTQTTTSLVEEDSEEFPRLQLSEILAISQSARMPDSLETTPTVVETLEPAPPSDEAAVDAAPIDPDVDLRISLKDEKDATNVELATEAGNTPHMGTPRLSDESYSFSNLSEKINSLNLPISKCPKIFGAPDDVIDLDELVTKPGAFGLMQRFMKHAKLKPKVKKDDSVVSVISSELNESGEVVNVVEEKIKVNKKNDDAKPGEKLVVLKTTLKQKMALNREQQFAKKLEEYKLYEEEFYGELKDDADDILDDEILSEDDDCCKKVAYDDKDDGDNSESEELDKNEFIDGVAEEDEVEEDVNSGAEQKSDEEDDCAESASVLLGDNSYLEDEVEASKEDQLSEGSDEEDDDSIPTPPMPVGLSSLPGVRNDGESLSSMQLMSLCSGTFETGSIDLKNLETTSQQIAMKDFDDEEEMKSLSMEKPDISGDGGESEDDDVVSTSKNIQKKRNRKLSFSDDDDDGDIERTVDDEKSLAEAGDDGSDKSGDENASDVDEDGNDEEFLNLEIEEDEDDEEVQLAKKLSRGFLEKEAELSGSEVGSDDEDEKGLDDYEEEEGDKEHISQRRLQKELGKIHMREMQAEDNREIRILQELLLEDGDLHSDGPKRQRLYRWSNQDDDPQNDQKNRLNDENGNDDGDDEDEESWRRRRLERENFLRKKKIDVDPDVVDSPVNFSDTRKGVKVIPKVMPPPKDSSPDPKCRMSIFGKRGSFLSRGDKMLSKLAEITNSKATENAGGNSRSNRNMVFSIVSPPKEQSTDEPSDMPTKRKGNFQGTSIVKKIKFSNSTTSNKVSILEQLKVFEST